MIMKLRNQPYAPKWEQEERKKRKEQSGCIMDVSSFTNETQLSGHAKTVNLASSFCFSLHHGFQVSYFYSHTTRA
ncbi:hypothetical protein B7P43_G03132 [Cryptotermes secundus]|uniref:Uncharacterized protein n=1 Tax=Cryptotermes secundus TaxID=105785 RepID=A0A2J7QND8_9NEOP|nr:hypothetical protein B7P43_G03132 [Cryptotermes secundus]